MSDSKPVPVLDPRAVACMRKVAHTFDNSFDAEIVFWDRHYLVSAGHKTRQQAIRAAEDACLSFRLAMKAESLLYIANQQWKEAKP